MSLSFNDLDTDMQRATFSATAILCIVLIISLLKIIHYVLIGGTFLATIYMSYMLFIKPRLTKNK